MRRLTHLHVRMLWKFNSVYDPDRLLADHTRPVAYALRAPSPVDHVDPRDLYILAP